MIRSQAGKNGSQRSHPRGFKLSQNTRVAESLIVPSGEGVRSKEEEPRTSTE